MSLVRINHNPTRWQLATFGGCWLLFFGYLGIAFLRRGDSWKTAAIFGAIAVVVPVIGLVLPRFMRWVYVGMIYLTFPIGFVISHLILGVVYYLVVTPTGLLMRLFGHDPLHRRRDANAKSYWVPRETPPDLKRYFRQF